MSSPTTEDAAARSFLSRFEPHGVSAGHSGCGAFMAFAGCSMVVIWLVEMEMGRHVWVVLLAVALFVLGVLFASRRVRTRLDVAGGAVVETRSLVFPYRSRRRPIDLSEVREVRLKTVRTVSRLMSSHSPTPTERVDCRAFLDGAVPKFVYEGIAELEVRRAGEYFAVALGVPLRLAEGEVLTPREICEPLRDRLAQRLLPATTPPPGDIGRLTVDEDEAAGTTRFTLPKTGAVRAIVRPAVWFNIVVLVLLIYFWGLRQGLVIAAALAAHSTLSVLFRSHGTAVATVLADGGIEVVFCYPVGGFTRRIAGDDLEYVRREGVYIRAEGWQRGFWFGIGLSSDELEWLEHALCLAMAERSESVLV